MYIYSNAHKNTVPLYFRRHWVIMSWDIHPFRFFFFDINWGVYYYQFRDRVADGGASEVSDLKESLLQAKVLVSSLIIELTVLAREIHWEWPWKLYSIVISHSLWTSAVYSRLQLTVVGRRSLRKRSAPVPRPVVPRTLLNWQTLLENHSSPFLSSSIRTVVSAPRESESFVR